VLRPVSLSRSRNRIPIIEGRCKTPPFSVLHFSVLHRRPLLPVRYFVGQETAECLVAAKSLAYVAPLGRNPGWDPFGPQVPCCRQAELVRNFGVDCHGVPRGSQPLKSCYNALQCCSKPLPDPACRETSLEGKELPHRRCGARSGNRRIAPKGSSLLE
jgi:hypothetical protein